jgi:hypothetical protein
MATEIKAQDNQESSAAIARVSRAQFPFSYHEVTEEAHVVPARLDVLEQLQSNIAQLEDLHGRMRFMMKEVRGLLKR